VEERARYRAFISYSHKDAAFGRRLHRRLENYRVPKRLVGRITPYGPVPPRLTPIFRDLDELPAAADLSAEVREALNASHCLIVVCSPAAAASRWVAREIEVFRSVHPDRAVLAAIVDGEPPDCFPRGLCGIAPDGEAAEPLAADFRRGHDGERLGLLKLAAGITGLGLDELVQRDAQRQTQRVMAVTAAALIAVLAMGALTAFALNARSEAERQRGEAEGLVEYMLTDLRDRLKGVGRLDVMTAVNERALKYYGDQDIARLPVDSLERRARILHAMGEDDETRGNHDAALKKFREAARTTSALLAEAPNDPERIFDQAQSEYWIGYVDYQRGRYAAAKPAFLRYKAMADRMVALAPQETKYRMEEAYAESNLCTIALHEPKDRATSVSRCEVALTQIEQASHHLDKSYLTPNARREVQNQIANSLANMSDAYRKNHNLHEAELERLKEEALLAREMAADPNDMDLRDTWIATQIALARLAAQQAHESAAKNRLMEALKAADAMRRFDPSNNRSRFQREYIAQELGHLKDQSATKEKANVTHRN
jgi:hypothetical protein